MCKRQTLRLNETWFGFVNVDHYVEFTIYLLECWILTLDVLFQHWFYIKSEIKLLCKSKGFLCNYSCPGMTNSRKTPLWSLPRKMWVPAWWKQLFRCFCCRWYKHTHTHTSLRPIKGNPKWQSAFVHGPLTEERLGGVGAFEKSCRIPFRRAKRKQRGFLVS